MNAYCHIKTPVGYLCITEDENGISSVNFTDKAGEENCKNAKFLLEAKKQLLEYFAGERTVFDIPLSLTGTDFQLKVWDELKKIPYGKTVCYGDIAAAVNNPKACRAVGMAIHCNPVGIIVPCHRVIGKNGSLTGFAAGLDIKQKLLTLEKSLLGG